MIWSVLAWHPPGYQTPSEPTTLLDVASMVYAILVMILIVKGIQRSIRWGKQKHEALQSGLAKILQIPVGTTFFPKGVGHKVDGDPVDLTDIGLDSLDLPTLDDEDASDFFADTEFE